MNDVITEKLLQLNIQLSELFGLFDEEHDFDLMVYAKWSAKDILGHLSFWHASFARNLQDVSQGRQPNPLKGKLTEVNERSVAETRPQSIPELIISIKTSQQLIEEHIGNPAVKLIPYKKGSRDYSPAEHLEVVAAHIKRHIKDIRKALKRSLKAKR